MLTKNSLNKIRVHLSNLRMNLNNKVAVNLKAMPRAIQLSKKRSNQRESRLQQTDAKHKYKVVKQMSNLMRKS